MPVGADRSQIAGPALEGVFVLGKGFMNFDNAPYGFIQPEHRTSHPEIRWAIANTERGNLLSLFLLLTVATSSLQGTWLNPIPYLDKFRVLDLHFGI
jgi:arginine exporter protein ArgO